MFIIIFIRVFIQIRVLDLEKKKMTGMKLSHMASTSAILKIRDWLRVGQVKWYIYTIELFKTIVHIIEHF